MDNMLDHYQAVLRDLELRLSRVQKESMELQQTIGGIKKLMSTTASLFVSAPLPASVASVESATTARPQISNDRKFAGMSVRWGVLKLMAEEANEALKTAQMAVLLLDGGMRSAGKTFASNVSAVVSDMVNQRKELEAIGETGTYRITDNGRLAWAAIKHSPKYVSRETVAVSPTLQ